MRKETARGNSMSSADDVAFFLFHLPASDHNPLTDDNAQVEFVCVANGIAGTTSLSPGCKSFAGLHLDLFL
jgi:hypothetical protein